MGGPASGPGIAVTRPGDTPGRLGELLRRGGAVVTHWPCIRFEIPVDPEPMANAVKAYASYDWIAVTSPRAARFWLESVAAAIEAPAAPRPAAAAAGPATAEVLRDAGWPVRRVADAYSATGLLEAFAAAGDAPGARILFPCSDRAGDELPEGLRRLGADVARVTAYRTVATPPDPAEVLAAARDGRVDVVTFTSPSTVEGFLAGSDEAQKREIRDRLAAVAIGPTTASTLRAGGWPASMANQATLEALADAALGSRAESRTGTRPS